MPALIDLRRRIKSVRNTQQITQAMKTVSTAKFKKAQRKVLETRPYWHGYPELISLIAQAADRYSHPLLEKRPERRVEVVIITSDKGLAGAFNSNLLERATDFLNKKKESSEVHLTLFGKKAVTHFKKLSFSIKREYIDQVQSLTDMDIQELAGQLMRDYAFRKRDAVYVVYNEFKSILAPYVFVTRLLPLEPPKPDNETPTFPPDWEPGIPSILKTLLPLYVEDQFRHFFHESLAAEHAARMMAMDNATKNAEELIDDLTLVLNKIRQASITKELLEIMSAVEAQAEKG